jgi:predicted transcriptional regulator YdeE
MRKNMQINKAQRPEMKLVGIEVRTNNETLFKSDPTTNPVAAIVQKYFHQGLANKINHRKKPGVTYCVYNSYASDHNGDYTYFIGEEVSSLSDVPADFKTRTIPAQDYAKFTSDAGPMPDVCINLWKHIWKVTPAELGGKRAYIADFEVYDERSHDHSNVVLDIYIGVKK